MLLMYFKETFVIAIYTFISVIISSLGLVAKGKASESTAFIVHISLGIMLLYYMQSI